MKYLLALLVLMACAPLAQAQTQNPELFPIQQSFFGTIQPPDIAINAGFTTLAGNYDFSSAFYTDRTPGDNSNWFDCNETNDALPWHGAAPGIFTTNCNIHQKADPRDSSIIILNIHQNVENCCKTTMSQANWNTDKFVNVSYPNWYVETVARLERTTVLPGDPPCGQEGTNGIWSWSIPQYDAFEEDFVELTQDCGGFGVDGGINRDQGVGPMVTSAPTPLGGTALHFASLPPGLAANLPNASPLATVADITQPSAIDPTTTTQATNGNDVILDKPVDVPIPAGDSIQITLGNFFDASAWQSYNGNNHLPANWSPLDYHKYGTLVTSDGATQTWHCTFVDDIVQNCGDMNIMSPSDYLTRMVLILWDSSDNGGQKNAIDYDIKYVHVFSCPSWQDPSGFGHAANMCNGTGPLVTNAQGVTYWKPQP